jgi:thioredoxin 1
MPLLLSPRRNAPTLTVDWDAVCLCAAWCRTCEGYRADLVQLAAHDPATRFIWLDVEDDADWVDALDVETFPTLLMLERGTPMFFGPLPPQIGVLERTLHSLRAPGAAAAPLDTDVQHALHDFGQRLRGWNG